MKKLVLSICFILSVLGLQAQNRKNVANFSLFQQYYNPALTGYEGSVVKTFYRNQWTGFEDAPKTIFASGELDLADYAAWKKDDQTEDQQDEGDASIGAQHAIGLAVLHDQFGPFAESQVFVSYASQVRLSERTSLRWGTAVTYSSQRLNGNRLTVDQENDPQYQDVLGNSNRLGKLDINLGLMMTSDKFYIGYAMQDITKGGVVTTGDTFLKDMYTRKHIIQGGYRTALSEQVGIVVNGIYQYDDQLQETVEGQLKAVYQNMLWIGGGYRKDLAYTFTGGVRLNQLTVGYAYEVPTGDANSINKNTNEIMLTYNLSRLTFPKSGRSVTIW